jgi:ankyrin repeat protein
MKGTASTAKLLLERGASISGQDKNGFNVLHMAILCSPKEITGLLLQRADVGLIINEKNRFNGATALMYAAMDDNAALVQSLLDKGANLNMKDYQGRSALMLAKEKGNAKVAALLEQWTKKQNPVVKRTKPFKGQFGL